MPFPFTFPTTSATALTTSFRSDSHPSLLLTATSQRALVRDVLKKHKRLPPASQATNIAVIQDALNSYLPYLLSIYHSAPDAESITSYGGQVQVSITETKDLITEWRTTLSAGVPGREPQRAKVKGLRNELAFVLQTLAYTYSHLARSSLLQLQRTISPSSEVRASFLATAMKHLLDTYSIHAYITSLNPTVDATPPLDVATTTASALASLALAEATITVTLKDDPYAAAVADDRDKDSKSWMISAPSIPKTRANLYARICIAAADHAAKASGLLPRSGGFGSNKIDDDLVKYVDDLRKTARAKAARWFAIAAEDTGKTGEAIAWLRGAKRELGVLSDDDSGKRKGFKGLKQSWTEKREDRKVEKGKDDWGMDAGKFEETRVIEWLEAKWVKSNDTVNVQVIPAFEPLLAQMPSGREYHTPAPYTPPTLAPEILSSMRSPVDPSQQVFTGDEDDSGDEGSSAEPVGAFPGTGREYSASRSSYY
ncbi:pH-response regulator protein-like protein palC [Elsinoe ampelina]|uniref:pH-response regulator protein palC n=1 Tax=Elsinoe ampelina TaxID=302913 RepID=A0A6A6GMP4_9PEZI|nr:pH-response regulator protein-like protein palC [Elsinoe ampelina]